MIKARKWVRVVTIYRHDGIPRYNRTFISRYYHTVYICLSTVFGENKRCRNFPLNCSLAPPHVQRRQHQRQRPLSLISIPQNINLNWQYGKTLDIKKDEWLFVLEYRHSSQKLVAKRGNTSNMFTYISEQHPSVQIQFCPIYNLILKPYDFRDVAWIPESSRDN